MKVRYVYNVIVLCINVLCNVCFLLVFMEAHMYARAQARWTANLFR